MTLEQLIELSSIGVAIFILLVLYLRGVRHIRKKYGNTRNGRKKCWRKRCCERICSQHNNHRPGQRVERCSFVDLETFVKNEVTADLEKQS